MTRQAIVLPGRAYGALEPVLRFPGLAAEQAGFTLAVVDYPDEALRDQDVEALVGAVRAQVASILDDGSLDEVVVIAKSLGTRLLVELVDLLGRVPQVSAIWLTPLFGNTDVRDAAASTGWRSLIVCGRADPFHDEAGTTVVSGALSARVVTLPDADHSLEVPGDVLRTVAGMSRLTEEAVAFMGGSATPRPSTVD